MNGLESLLEPVIDLHQQELVPSQKSVRLPHHKRKRQYSKRGDHVSLGAFYELLTKSLYGGHLVSTLYNTSELDYPTRPDVVSKDNKIIWESKAAVINRTLNLLDYQVTGYKHLQLNHPNSQIRFAIYRHSVRGIKSYPNTEEELLKELTGTNGRSTVYSIVLPLSVVVALHESRDEDIIYRYDGEAYDVCTVLRSKIPTRFITEPEIILDQLGLDPKDFEVDRLISPKNFRMGTRRLKQFPIVHIQDKDHKEWYDNFANSFIPF